jgi:hypothetical protein
MGWDWINLVRWPLSGLLYQLRMICDECEAVGGMRIGRGSRSTRRKLPQCHFVHHKSHMTCAIAVGSRRLTAWVTAWCKWKICCLFYCLHTRLWGWIGFVSNHIPYGSKSRNLKWSFFEINPVECSLNFKRITWHFHSEGHSRTKRNVI